MNMESRRPGPGSGSPMVDPASRPREPNLNPGAAQPLDAVNIFCPGASDDECLLRLRIHRAHGAMAAKATRSMHGRARAHYWWGSQLAADWVFRPATPDDLTEILWALSRTFLSAGAIERLEAPDE